MNKCGQSGCWAVAVHLIDERGFDGRVVRRAYCARHVREHSDAPLAPQIHGTVSTPPAEDRVRAEKRVWRAPRKRPVSKERRWYPALRTSTYTRVLAYCVELGRVPEAGRERVVAASAADTSLANFGRTITDLRKCGLVRGFCLVQPAARDELIFRRGVKT